VAFQGCPSTRKTRVNNTPTAVSDGFVAAPGRSHADTDGHGDVVIARIDEFGY
jgi:hypothetical protein